MVRNRHKVSIASCSLYASLLFITPVYAADWVITPNVNVNETYSDNMFLAPSNQTVSGIISTITPGISITGKSDRLKLNLSYALEDMTYAENGLQNLLYNQLNSNANLELIKHTFFVDASASILQQPLTPFGPVSANSANLSGNVVNVDTVSISPYLTHQFDTFATGIARYTHTNATYSYGGTPSPGTTNYAYVYGPPGVFSTNTDAEDYQLNSGSAFDRLSWGIDYNNAVNTYSGFPTTTISLLTTNWNYLLTPQFQLTSQIGYENDNYVYFGPRPQGLFWNAGFNWALSPRTKLAITAGKRFYGSTYSFNFNHYSRMTVWNASYTQAVVSSAMQESVPTATTLDQLLQAQIPDPVARQQEVQQMMQNLSPQGALFGQNIMSNLIYLSKTLQFSTGLNTPRNTALITIYHTQSTPLEQNNVSLIGSGYLGYGNMTQTGGTVSWAHQLTPVISSNVNINYSKIDFGSQEPIGTTDFVMVGLTRKINPKFFGNLSLRHQAMNSGSYGYNFTENALIASLTYLY
ncbi:MAG: TIGR03016 family PEP-CTERM system-associated outer membrane protein [Burkholderiales bacterium]